MKNKFRASHRVIALAAALAAIGFSTGAAAQTSSSGSGFGMGNYSFMTPGSSYVGFNVGRTDYSLGGGTGLYGVDDRDTRPLWPQRLADVVR